MKTVELTRACHDLYKAVENKAGENIVGALGFRFNDSVLYAVGKTRSHRMIYLELAEIEFKDGIALNTFESTPRSEVFEILFLQLSDHGDRAQMTRNGFERLVILSLIDFFKVLYHSFH